MAHKTLPHRRQDNGGRPGETTTPALGYPVVVDADADFKLVRVNRQPPGADV
jgi:hypothetical protein